MDLKVSDWESVSADTQYSMTRIGSGAQVVIGTFLNQRYLALIFTYKSSDHLNKQFQATYDALFTIWRRYLLHYLIMCYIDDSYRRGWK